MKKIATFVLGFASVAGACYGQAPTLHLLQLPPSGWPQAVSPLAVSGNGSTIVGFQPSGGADFPYSAAVRWSGTTGQVIDYLMPDMSLGEGTYSFHRSVNWNGSIHTSIHNYQNLIFINGVSSPASPLGQSIISQNGQRILINTFSSIIITDRATGTTITQFPGNVDDFSEPNRFASAGDAFVTRQTYWREGFGFVQGNSLTPPLFFYAVSGDGQWAYGAHFLQAGGATYFRYSHEHGVEPVEIQSAISVSEHAEVVMSELRISTPRHGIETITQFLQREGVDLSPLNGGTPSGIFISRDGRTLVGYASAPAETPWTVRLPGDYLCDSIDFNNDGLTNPDDIAAFMSRYSEGPCIPETATCNDIDFNNDTSLFDPEDINAFLRVYSEGPCIE